MTLASDVRRPAVAGRFYPDDPAALDEEVQRFLAGGAAAERRLAVMAPHAGYVYSGGIAGRVFAATEVPRRVIVLAPNHTGRGKWGAVWTRGAFELPGFTIPVDEALCAALTAGKGPLAHDREAHRLEHALEVELPFLRARRADLQLTPIILGPLELDECLDVGARLARAVEALGEDVLVVASSDMNHYLSDEETRRIDHRALEPLLALDAERLYRTVRDEDISMCGVVPATAMLAYARARHATRADLVGYATSGDAFGERDRVVGYAGVTIV
ncbi:MAG TPA: AmmeMemoRadiSam system protein B [Polyangia bacterium]|nr:AmmeMemoRadiSam system protein B [Polyangia bacterium]